jgi:hypothetical protein
MQFIFKCSTICLNAFIQTKAKIIANVFQHIFALLKNGRSNLSKNDIGTYYNLLLC